MILTAARFLGWKVVTNGTLSIAVLFATTLFKISTLDLVDARTLPLLMTSSGYPRDAKKVSILAASMSKSASSLQILRRLRNWLKCMDDLQLLGWDELRVEVRVAICAFVVYGSGYAISSRLHVNIPERKFVRGNRPCIFKPTRNTGKSRRCGSFSNMELLVPVDLIRTLVLSELFVFYLLARWQALSLMLHARALL